MKNIKSQLKKLFFRKRFYLKAYKPLKKAVPEKTIQITSAWKGLELIIEDILNRFNIERGSCIEFGVEYGFSTVVFSNYFKKVTGVDTFIGDKHSAHKGDHYDQTKKAVNEFKNIELFKSDYRDWIQEDTNQYDFAHVDIVHDYKETYECGLWAVQHSSCCIFHDTESFPEVRRAVFDIAKNSGKKVYNYPYHNGLGIIV
jgi:hypothetical protein